MLNSFGNTTGGSSCNVIITLRETSILERVLKYFLGNFALAERSWEDLPRMK
jgi:hypothetical protein